MSLRHGAHGSARSISGLSIIGGDSTHGKRTKKEKPLPKELSNVNFETIEMDELENKLRELLQMNKIDVAESLCKRTLKALPSSKVDFARPNKLNWIDVKIHYAKMILFYKYYSGDDQLLHNIYRIFSRVLDSLQREVRNNEKKKASQKIPDLEKTPYYVSLEAECRTGMALSLSKLSNNTQHGSAALEHIRRAVKLDRNNALAHAVYGYILDRCFDKYKSSRQYLEYALNLDDTLSVGHLWLAMLLANFEKEFDELNQQVQQFKQQSGTTDLPLTPLSDEGEGEGDEMVRQFSEHQQQLRQASAESNDTETKKEDNSAGDGATAATAAAMGISVEELAEIRAEEADFGGATKAVSDEELPASATAEAGKSKKKHRRRLSAAMKTVVMLGEESGELLEVVTDEKFRKFIHNAQTIISANPKDHFRRAIELDPRHSVYYSSFASWQMVKKHWSEAKEAYQHALTLDKDNIVAKSNMAWVCALPRFSEFEHAKMLWEEVLERQPNNAVVHANLGRLCCHVYSDYQMAQTHYLKALTLDKRNPHYQFWMGVSCKYYEMNDSKARSYFSNSKKLLEGRYSAYDAIPYIQQAVILLNHKRYDVSKHVLKRALTIDKSQEEVIRQITRKIKKAAKSSGGSRSPVPPKRSGHMKQSDFIGGHSFDPNHHRKKNHHSHQISNNAAFLTLANSKSMGGY